MQLTDQEAQHIRDLRRCDELTQSTVIEMTKRAAIRHVQSMPELPENVIAFFPHTKPAA